MKLALAIMYGLTLLFVLAEIWWLHDVLALL